MTADYYAMLRRGSQPITANEIDGGSRRRGDVAGERGVEDSWRLHYLSALYCLRSLIISATLSAAAEPPSMLYTLLGDRKAKDCITLAAQHAERSGEMDVAIQLFRPRRAALISTVLSDS